MANTNDSPKPTNSQEPPSFPISPEKMIEDESKEKLQEDLFAIEEVNETVNDEESRSSEASKLGWTGRTEDAN